MTQLHNSSNNLKKNIFNNKVRIAFLRFPNLIPIIKHKTNIHKLLIEISKNENLVIVYNINSKLFELHNIDKYNVEYKKLVGSTYETTFPKEFTQVSIAMLKWLFEKDQYRNNVFKQLEYGKKIKQEKKDERLKRTIKNIENWYYKL